MIMLLKCVAMKSSFSLSVVIVLITTNDSTIEFGVISNVASLLTKPLRRALIASKRAVSDATRVFSAAKASRNAVRIWDRVKGTRGRQW